MNKLHWFRVPPLVASLVLCSFASAQLPWYPGAAVKDDPVEEFEKRYNTIASRSQFYDGVSTTFSQQNIDCRFFSAASFVSNEFVGFGRADTSRVNVVFTAETNSFLTALNAKLFRHNVAIIKQLCHSGGRKVNDRVFEPALNDTILGIIGAVAGVGPWEINASDLDRYLVEMEQEIVQRELDSLSSDAKARITANINDGLRFWAKIFHGHHKNGFTNEPLEPSTLDYVALAEESLRRRTKNPNLKIDFAERSHREAIGNILIGLMDLPSEGAKLSYQVPADTRRLVTSFNVGRGEQFSVNASGMIQTIIGASGPEGVAKRAGSLEHESAYAPASLLIGVVMLDLQARESTNGLGISNPILVRVFWIGSLSQGKEFVSPGGGRVVLGVNYHPVSSDPKHQSTGAFSADLSRSK